MAAYDYRCHRCDEVFTVQRPMTDAASPVRCPAGHADAARVWTAVSVTGRAAAAPAGRPAPTGGCCGGGCCG